MPDYPATALVEFARPVDVALTWSVLRRGRGDPAMQVDGPTVWRATRNADGPVTLAVEQSGQQAAHVRAWGPGAEHALARAHDMLGGADDDSGFVPSHPLLADEHRRLRGLRIPRTGAVTETLIGAIIEQKVTGVDAFAAWRRLVTRFGDPAPGPAPPGLYVPPSAGTWAALPSWEWHAAGVDPRRYRAAQAAARAGERLDALAHDPDRVRAAMLSIPGIGVWTAAQVGMRALGDADAVPFGDYHLAALVGTGLRGRRLESDDEVAEALEPWRPQRYRVVRLLELSPRVRIERHGPRMSRVDHRRI